MCSLLKLLENIHHHFPPKVDIELVWIIWRKGPAKRSTQLPPFLDCPELGRGSGDLSKTVSFSIWAKRLVFSVDPLNGFCICCVAITSFGEQISLKSAIWRWERKHSLNVFNFKSTWSVLVQLHLLPEENIDLCRPSSRKHISISL